MRGCSTRPCRRRPSPGSTWSATRTASCGCWRTICGCRRARPTRWPCAKRSAPELGAGREPRRLGRLRPGSSARRSARAAPDGARRPGRGARLRRPARAAPGTSTDGSGASSGSRSSTPAAARAARGRLFARRGRDRAPARRPLPPPRRGPPQRAGRAADRRSASCCCRRCSGRLRCVNAFGTGLADDKLAHAYVEEHDPLLPRRGAAAALGAELRPLRRERPRRGAGAARRAGGQAARRLRRPRRDDHAARDRAAAAARDRARAPRAPSGFIAQETVQLSSHPTVCGGAAASRGGSTCAPSSSQRRRRRLRDARRPHPLRARRRRDGRQQLARRRLQGHLGVESGDERVKRRSLASRGRGR